MNRLIQLYIEDENKWYDELKIHLMEVLFSNRSEYLELFDDKYKSRWIASFTHKSANPNSNQNYEIYEFRGDKLLKQLLVELIVENKPEFQEDVLTYIDHNLLSKHQQYKESIRLGLDNFIISYHPISNATREDVFEAFIGVLFDIGNDIDICTGYEIPARLVKVLYLDYVMSLSADNISKSSITIVKEIFTGMRWIEGDNPSPIEEHRKIDRDEIFYVKLTKQALHDLKFLGLPEEIVNTLNSVPYIGSSIGHRNVHITKDEAKHIAYDNALKTLRSIGISDDFFRRYKSKMNVRKSEFDIKDEVINEQNIRKDVEIKIEKIESDNTKSYYLMARKSEKDFMPVVVYTRTGSFDKENVIYNKLIAGYKDLANRNVKVVFV